MTSSRASLVFVLGMHRSGTSLATRMVQACGLQVPGKALSANADNPEGYSEPRALVRANNRILGELDRHWADDRPFDAGLQQRVFAAWHKRAVRLLRGWMARDQHLVLKDPRLCLTMPLWRDAAQELEADIRVLLLQREPLEVSASLAKRYDNPAFRPAAIIQSERSALLYQRYTLWAEWHTRGLAREQLSYEQLIAGEVEPLRRLLKPWWPQDDAPCSLIQPTTQAGNPAKASSHTHTLPAVDQARHQIILDQQRQAYAAVQARYADLRSQVAPPPQIEPFAPALQRGIGHAKAAPENLSGHVIFISDAPASRGHIYRVEHAATALKQRGMRVDIVNGPENVTLAQDTSAIVLFRLRWSAQLDALAQQCRQRAIALIYDIDDAVFDSALMTPAYFDYLRVREDQHEHWVRSAPQYQAALKHCDAALLTTEPLAERASAIQPHCFVVPNGLAENRLNAPLRQPEADLVRIGYASGTPTHQKDFAEVAAPVAELLRRHAHVRLCVLGHLDLEEFPLLAPLTDQIELRPLVAFDQLPSELARFDINLAPLQSNNPFCACKSELKYFEAAAVGVVSVASPTPPMRQAIIDGHTGFIAETPQHWLSLLNNLIEQPDLRRQCARRAYLHARACYGPQPRGEWYVSVFCRILESYAKQRRSDSARYT